MEADAVTTIPLDQLRATRLNVRRTGSGSIDDLAASIAHHGLIHNLTVIKGEAVGNGGTGGYLVVAGSRRLKALTKLQAAGALPATLVDGIPCRIVDRDEGHEASLAENVIREAMHPADEFDAFHSLANDGSGCSTAEIAERFGKSELYVRQRLKLANVAPAILDEYRAGKATLEQMMALALTDDQLQQQHVWKGAKQEWQRRPDLLRSAITQKELAATSKLAKFIGIDAYEKAGGEVRRDIFGSDADAFLVDVKLANKLAEEKLERTAEKIRKEGWAWVETRIEFPYSDRYTFGTAQSTWKGSKQTWTDDAKSHAGVVVSIAHNGQTEIERGLVRPQDRKAAAKAGGAVTGGKEAKAARKPGDLSFAAIQRLQAEAGDIIAAEVATMPRTALALLAAELAGRALYDHTWNGPRTWVHIHREASGRMPGNIAQISGRAPAASRMEEQAKAWRDRLPKKLDELRPFLLQQEFEFISKLLAYLVAREIDVVDVSPGMKGGVVELATAAKVDLGKHWKATEEWLATMPKATVLAMAKDAGGGEIALGMLAKEPKATMPAKAMQFFPAGWIPKVLRPKAPVRPKPAAKKVGKKRQTEGSPA
ncbi:ParB/RepB/Spo0J family partition protein [Dyella lutea]|uniref:ParB/RepB/Spo0J family partition protein n=1 Tax=Dyella lutea TaxID=2950441 RepID=A0ABT1FHT8_9GAMM|nr:ParB/RepB/Spo0J family partition protein [Dyella lutea]MCP1375988.1 ParB/RepB/Spo0J family partition protein [Dyella lutea]